MRVEAGYQRIFEGRPSSGAVDRALALGVFDGVHKGHQALIKQVVHNALTHGLVASAMTFEPHPLTVVAKQAAPLALMSMAERLKALEDLGLVEVIVQPFDKALAALSPASFVHEVLSTKLGCKSVVVGENFRFGHGGMGDAAMLRKLAQTVGIDAHIVEPVIIDGHPVSSTSVRHALTRGDVPQARALLGRCPTLVGTVEHGAGRGQAALGVATANFSFPQGHVVLPAGVYAAWAEGLFGKACAVVNIGVAPTFEKGRALKVEAHLLDWHGESLYGQSLTLSLVSMMRQERRFDGKEALIAQIKLDIYKAKQTLHNDATSNA